MRDAFGGTFMINIALIFMCVYISFMAIAVQYSKAFRVKNQVINFVEQYQFDGTQGHEAVAKIDAWLAKVPYKSDQKSKCEEMANNETNSNGVTFTPDNGACIITMCEKDGATCKANTTYYKVVTFITGDINFFGIDISFPVSGETKIVQ